MLKTRLYQINHEGRSCWVTADTMMCALTAWNVSLVVVGTVGDEDDPIDPDSIVCVMDNTSELIS